MFINKKSTPQDNLLRIYCVLLRLGALFPAISLTAGGPVRAVRAEVPRVVTLSPAVLRCHDIAPSSRARVRWRSPQIAPMGILP